MHKKFFAILMSIMIILTFMPSMAFADDVTVPAVTSNESVTISQSSFNFYDISEMGDTEIGEDFTTGEVTKNADAVTSLAKKYSVTVKYDCSEDGNPINKVGLIATGTAVNAGIKFYAQKEDSSNIYDLAVGSEKFDLVEGTEKTVIYNLYIVADGSGQSKLHEGFEQDLTAAISTVAFTNNKSVNIDFSIKDTESKSAAYISNGNTTKYYSTLQRALDAAATISGDLTVGLLRNATEDVSLKGACTIAGNGYSVKSISALAQSDEEQSWAGIELNNIQVSGDVTITSKNYEISNVNIKNIRAVDVVIDKASEVSIDDVSMTKLSLTKCSGVSINNSSANTILVSGDSDAEIINCKSEKGYTVSRSSITLNGDIVGNVYAQGHSLVNVESLESFTINGQIAKIYTEYTDTCVGQEDGAWDNEGATTIADFKYKETWTKAVGVLCNGVAYKSIDEALATAKKNKVTNLTITLVTNTVLDLKVPNGMKITLETGSYSFDGTILIESATTEAERGTVIIKSGKFAKNPSEYVDEKIGVVEIGGRYYVGLQDIKLAIEAASAGTTINLVKSGEDVTQSLAEIKELLAKKGQRLNVPAGTFLGQEFDEDITTFLDSNRECCIKMDNGRYIVISKSDRTRYENERAIFALAMSNAVVTAKVESVSDKTATISMNCKKGEETVNDISFSVNKEATTTNPYVIKGLEPGTTYEYDVEVFKTVLDKYRVYCPANAKVTIKTKPSKPSKVKVTKAKKALKVKVSKTAGAKKYQISVSTKKSGTSIKTTTTSVSKTIKKLKSKKTYYVKVRAIGANNVKGSWSKVVKCKTK